MDAPKLTFEHRLKFAEIEVQLIQSRFDKFDQLFQGNRRFAVALIAAAFATSAALDQKLALYGASFASLIMFWLELSHRKTLFAKLVERHLLLRAALNDPAILMKLVVYDPFNDMGSHVPEDWRAEKSKLFTHEMVVFYLALCLLPIVLAMFIHKPVLQQPVPHPTPLLVTSATFKANPLSKYP